MNGEQRCAVRNSRRKLCGQEFSPPHEKPPCLQALFLILSKITAWLRKEQKWRCGLRCSSNRAYKIRCRERARVLFDCPTRYTLPEADDLMNSNKKKRWWKPECFRLFWAEAQQKLLFGSVVRRHLTPPRARTAAEISSVLALHHLFFFKASLPLRAWLGESTRGTEQPVLREVASSQHLCTLFSPWLN